MKKNLFFFLALALFSFSGNSELNACGPLDPQQKVLDFVLSHVDPTTGRFTKVIMEDGLGIFYTFRNPPNSSADLEALQDCFVGGKHSKVDYYVDCTTNEKVIIAVNCTSAPLSS